jgi:hypothetical protein
LARLDRQLLRTGGKDARELRQTRDMLTGKL